MASARCDAAHSRPKAASPPISAKATAPAISRALKSLFLARSPFYGVAQMLMSLHKKPAAVAEVAESHSQGIVGAVGPALRGGS